MRIRNAYWLVSRGCLLLFALLILNSCKQIFLNDAEYEIIEESNRLMKQERLRLEERHYVALYAMNSRASNRSQHEVQQVYHSLLFLENYKKLAKRIEDFPGKYPRDATDSISLFIREIGVTERVERIIGGTDFRDQLYYNSNQLKLDLAWKVNRILIDLYHTMGLHGSMLTTYPAILSTADEVRLFIPMYQTGDFLKEISYSIDLKDSLEIKGLPPWVRIEYSASTEFIKVTYQNKKGELIDVEFDEIAQLKFY